METRDRVDRLYDLHAAICKALANPWRLRIVEELGERESTGWREPAGRAPRHHQEQRVAAPGHHEGKGCGGPPPGGRVRILPAIEPKGAPGMPAHAGGSAGAARRGGATVPHGTSEPVKDGGTGLWLIRLAGRRSSC